MANINEIHETVTKQIIADLENGERSWVKPWNAEHIAGPVTRPLRHNGVPYNGINVLMLWASALARNFAAPFWLTYRQTSELGAQVCKGEKGSAVVYANSIVKTEHDENGEESERLIPYLKTYSVFNADQIDALPEHYTRLAEPTLDPVQRIKHADAFFTATRADIRHGGNCAFYSIATDHIQMPPFEAFRDAESYVATLAHELMHWTRHKSRLDRDFDGRRWGDEGYAREELVAELGAAFLSADLGITPLVREDHAAYIGSWLQILKHDNRAIFTAAANAQRAVDFLHGLQGGDPQVDTAS